MGENIFKNIENIKSNLEDIDKKDSRGRTPLINSIVQRKSIDIIESIIRAGANLELKDKLGDTALKKAIKFKRIDVVELLIKYGVNIQSENIENSPWFFARKNKKIADILLETKGSIRLTLSSDEENILEELLYNEDIDDICSKIENLDSSEILHAFVLDFNYDDEWLPIVTVLNNDNCKEITAIEIIELLTDGDISHLKIIDEKIFNLISIKYSDLILRLKTNMCI
ncbi:ankyrin repeat domain-containing protein [Romboutsia lituseburensis]|nr:ankyrin repeat domain-containing protein [Romboutsia lituseburensis]